MILAFLNLGIKEFFILISIALLVTIVIGNYGRDTALGYWGSILLSLFASPIVAFVVIYVLRKRRVA